MNFLERISHLRRIREKPSQKVVVKNPPQPEPKGILWDLDQTVGDFRGYPISKMGEGEAPPLALRYGMADLLDDLSPESGFFHIITSSNGLGTIGEILRRVHLDKKFKTIYGKDEVDAGEGKKYLPVGRDLQYSHEKMRTNLLVIGDSNHDKPVDIGGLVFMELPLNLDALVAREIVTSLLEAGDGNFKAGYENLYNSSKVIEVPQLDRVVRKREVDIGNDIRFRMEYRRADMIGDPTTNRVPVIYDITTDTHRKDPIPFF